MDNSSFLRQPINLEKSFDADSLRNSLETAGFTESSIGEVLQIREEMPGSRIPGLFRTAKKSRLNSLVRLFVLNTPLPEEDLQLALEGYRVSELLEMGVLRRTDRGITSVGALLPASGTWILQDTPPQFDAKDTPVDHVLGVSQSTRTANCLSVRRANQRIWDLGTGSGFLALQLSEQARQVIGTDTNARALNFAAFNARLNGVHNVEFRPGSLDEPVSGEKFDVITANLPFVISPGVDLLFRDGGFQGDGISRYAAQRLPAFLEEGGFLTAAISWCHRDDDDWEKVPKSWCEGNGCDAWLIHNAVAEPVHHAALWIDQKKTLDEGTFREEMERWTSFYEDLDIRRISLGVLLLRKRSGVTHWFRADHVADLNNRVSCSPVIERIYAAEDLLHQPLSTEQFLQLRFRLVEGHEMQQTLLASERKWKVQKALIRQTSGMEFRREIDRMVSILMAGSDGRSTLSELLQEVSAGLKIDLAQLSQSAVEAVRGLVRSGYLVAESYPGRQESSH